jgi:hypothetical protein
MRSAFLPNAEDDLSAYSVQVYSSRRVSAAASKSCGRGRNDTQATNAFQLNRYVPRSPPSTQASQKNMIDHVTDSTSTRSVATHSSSGFQAWSDSAYSWSPSSQRYTRWSPSTPPAGNAGARTSVP